MKFKLGISPCPNDTFIFDALLHGRIDTEGFEFEVVFEDVETLNQMSTRSELELTKLSYFAYGSVSDRYILMNSGSALGNNCGPLLIAKTPMATIRGKHIAIPGERTTANFLFRIRYPDPFEAVYMPFDEIENSVLSGQVDAGVIIHENRFTFEDKGLVKICDLGEAWESNTGFPIPLGGIAARRDLPEETIRKVDRLIRSSVLHAFAHPEDCMDFVRAHAQEMEDAVMRNHIALYVNDYSKQLGEQGREAVHFMLNKAVELRMLDDLTHPLIIDADQSR